MSPTTSPDKYAQEVASALWSTDYPATTRFDAVAFWYDQLADRIPAGAPPGTTLEQTRREAMSSLDPYLPNADMWAQLATTKTRSRFVLTGVTIPESWTEAVAAGQITDPGLSARLVTGRQETATKINGTDSNTEQPQSLLIVMLCPPTTSTCHLEILPPAHETP